tara:strand:- start:59 stop:535 length:477 start_codon:yes stop_codon:yes gene_type:complete
MGSSFKLKGGRGKMDPYAALQRQGLISPVRQVEGDDPRLNNTTTESSGGKTGEVAGRTGSVSSFDSGMEGYDKSSSINDRGEMIHKFTPKSSTKNAKTVYYAQRQGGDASTEEISKDQYIDYLSKGSRDAVGRRYKFRPQEEQDVGTGGASLSSLGLD